MLQIRLRPQALEDLDSIWDYTVDAWDTEQAEKYFRALNRTFEKTRSQSEPRQNLPPNLPRLLE